MRLQCNICGAKSIEFEERVTLKQGMALREFQDEHNATCATDKAIYPQGACSVELPKEVIAAAQVGPFGSDKRPLVSVRRPHGRVEMTGPYGEQQTGDTLSCCHCRHHWIVRKGSGITRGFCQRCMGYTCGKPACMECVPFQQRLDNMDAGLPALQQRIIGAVPAPQPEGESYDVGTVGDEAERDQRPPQADGEDAGLWLAPS